MTITTKKSVIYEPAGRAREYSEKALNLYPTCNTGHCLYCYARIMKHKTAEQFFQPSAPRVTPDDIRASAEENVDGKPVLLCFACDPYPPEDEKYGITRQAISILQEHHPVIILTKAGELARRDFDILRPGIDSFWTSLTCASDEESRRWEPGAAPPAVRIENLRLAKECGLKTGVSCEPVIYPQDTFTLVAAASIFADQFKFGPLNYHPHAKTIAWGEFVIDIIKMQPMIKKPFYIKKDLAQYMGMPTGLWIGNI
jgi:DNA repair photolyase